MQTDPTQREATADFIDEVARVAVLMTGRPPALPTSGGQAPR